ncbi:phenylacetate--CoA ligase family protein [Variovorax sp. JS1663]|uniref:phenylacetate--CoA ligase family protein n=1 Tax=Variovorax sp. JS1663 TaxID=1851577 RepID=UPI000B347D33|nr:phenylacetate--CoA ligase family protein [Variovorax sp. JS1663]
MDSVALGRLQSRRLQQLVAHARAHSPYYREHYWDVPPAVADPSQLPVTTKKALMDRFDDWVTDPRLTFDQVRACSRDVQRIGEQLLGTYTVATTSGTTGVPGMFVLDERAMKVTKAIATRMLGDWLSWRDMLMIVRSGGRLSMVMATGGHFASAVAAARMEKHGRNRRLQVLSVHTPLPKIVRALNDFQPAVIAPYASMAAQLANEQGAGRLRIAPALLALSAEGLLQAEYARIARVFGAEVGNSYACTECTFLSHSCPHGWLHVNSDWALLEPVDAHLRPVAPGVRSQTVLLSNLANWVQPILRYDLGDRVIQRPDPCECGSPFPAIRVEGRTADVLELGSPGGRRISIPFLSFAALEDRVNGLDAFQVVQTSADALSVRVTSETGEDERAVRSAATTEVERILASHEVRAVRVTADERAPERTQGGKHRPVIPLKN